MARTAAYFPFCSGIFQAKIVSNGLFVLFCCCCRFDCISKGSYVQVK